MLSKSAKLSVVALALLGLISIGLLLASQHQRAASPALTASGSETSPGIPSAIPARTPDPTPTMAARVIPVSVSIESAGIDSSLMPLGLNSDGTLEVPPDSSISGWYTGGPKPGELGPAVIASHVSWKGVKGPFFTLDQVIVGDFITVVNSDASNSKFEVTKTVTYKKEDFPTELVYGDLNYAGIRLVTCDRFDIKKKEYANNLIVYGKLVQY